MKIAFLSSLDPTDIHKWSGTLYYMYRELCRRGHDVTWEGRGWIAKRKKLHEVQCPGVPFRAELYTEEWGEVVAKALIGKGYDVILARDYFFIATLRVPIPIVYVGDTTSELQNTYYNVSEPTRSFLNRIERLAIHHADRVVYSSEWAKDSAVSFFHASPDKVSVIEFGANLPDSLTQWSPLPACPECCQLLFVGKEWGRKGGDLAYETFRELRRRQFPCELTIIGSVPSDFVPEEGVTVFRHIDKARQDGMEQLAQEYEKACFLLLPTEYDCYGIVFAEASAFGVPSLARNVGGVGQVVRDGVNGFLLSPDATATDFADVICRVYGDRRFYYQLRCSAKKEYQIRLNWRRWGEMMEQIFQEVMREVKMKESHVYIPTYIINLRRRPDRKKHILSEFEGREEFQTFLVEACEHKVGAVGLWMSIRKIVEDAVQRDYDAILICEDDHEFTPQYSKETLFRHIYGAYRQGAELLSGGIGGFGVAVPTAANRYWVDWFWCTQFIVIYKKLYARILSYNFKDTDTADGVLSGLARFKMVIYPFVSRQKAFGYSDITEGNIKHPDLIVRHFERADVRLKQVHAVSHIYNYPWDNDQVDLAPSDNK